MRRTRLSVDGPYKEVADAMPDKQPLGLSQQSFLKGGRTSASQSFNDLQ